MATDVRNILLNIIKTKGNMSENEAQQYIKKMETQKRYSADVWS
jgi:NADPH-ferrihemoprotein reductase